MKRTLWGGAALAVPLLALAQRVRVTETGESLFILPSAGYFFVALVAGVLLAAAFQLMLTNLSVAAGLNMLGSITDARKRRSAKKSSHRDTDEGGMYGAVQTFNSSLGLWTLITASVSLFFAAWFATELSLAVTAMIGAMLGLTVWALFYLVMMTLEARAVSSLVGSLVRMATSGLRSAYHATTAVFQKSPEDRMADAAGKITESVKKELFGSADADDIRDHVRKWVAEILPEPVEPERIRKEIVKLLDDIEIEAVRSHEGPLVTKDTIVARLHAGGNKERAEAVAGAVSGAIEAIRGVNGDGNGRRSVGGLLKRLAGMTSGELPLRTRIEEYLRNTGKEELNPDVIRGELQRMFTEPREGLHALRERLSHMDKSTLTALLSQRKDLTPEEAQKVVDTADEVIRKLRTRVRTAADDAKRKVEDYVHSLNDTDEKRDTIAAHMQRLFREPKAEVDEITRRLKSIDRNTVKQALVDRTNLKEEDVERVIRRIEDARDSVLYKADQMKAEVRTRLELAAQETKHQADQARKVAASAAWWAFGTAAASAVAAVLGGIAAVSGA